LIFYYADCYIMFLSALSFDTLFTAFDWVSPEDICLLWNTIPSIINKYRWTHITPIRDYDICLYSRKPPHYWKYDRYLPGQHFRYHQFLKRAINDGEFEVAHRLVIAVSKHGDVIWMRGIHENKFQEYHRLYKD